MSEQELLGQLKSLVETNQTDKGIEILKQHTGKGKIIDPSNTEQMERIWSSFLNDLLRKGQVEDSLKVCRQMLATLTDLQRQDNARYHKGFPLYNSGNLLLQQAFIHFLFAFIEDTVNLRKFPEDMPSVTTLQGIFKVDSEFIDKLSQDILAKMPDAKDPRDVVSALGIRIVPVELWRLEYAMQEVERKLRKFIESRLSSDPEWWEKLIPEEVKKAVGEKITTSSEILWFSEQPLSPLDYLIFPREYVQIITDDKCWDFFKTAFGHKAIIRGKLSGLGQIRNKIAHYRKISDRERQMFEETVKWLIDRLK